MFISTRKVTAAEEPETEPVVSEEATDLLFESEDVAELLAEVTGEPVEVTADEDTVVFAVGEDEYTVEAEGSEEVLEAVKFPARKRTVSANRKPTNNGTARKRTVAASKTASTRTIRKVPSGK